MERFRKYTAESLDTLLEVLNAEQTIFSVVVFMGKEGRLWSAVLDFSFQPVATPADIEDMQKITKEDYNRLWHYLNDSLVA